jgi:hypothetical protein
MEYRGTGVPVRRPPGQWEKETLPITQEPKQGPMKTSEPTSRSQAPIPGEVQTQFAQMPGSFFNQIIAGRAGMQAEKFRSGGGGNTSASASAVPEGGPMTSKPGVEGSTNGGAHFGAGAGGF